MRPGRKGPGNVYVAGANNAGVDASMRPGRKGPGNAITVEEQRKLIGLLQ